MREMFALQSGHEPAYIREVPVLCVGDKLRGWYHVLRPATSVSNAVDRIEYRENVTFLSLVGGIVFPSQPCSFDFIRDGGDVVKAGILRIHSAFGVEQHRHGHGRG